MLCAHKSISASSHQQTKNLKQRAFLIAQIGSAARRRAASCKAAAGTLLRVRCCRDAQRLLAGRCWREVAGGKLQVCCRLAVRRRAQAAKRWGREWHGNGRKWQGRKLLAGSCWHEVAGTKLLAGRLVAGRKVADRKAAGRTLQCCALLAARRWGVSGKTAIHMRQGSGGARRRAVGDVLGISSDHRLFSDLSVFAFAGKAGALQY